MIIISNVTLLILHNSGRKRPERRNASDRSARMPSHHRVCFRCATTLGGGLGDSPRESVAGDGERKRLTPCRA